MALSKEYDEQIDHNSELVILILTHPFIIERKFHLGYRFSIAN